MKELLKVISDVVTMLLCLSLLCTILNYFCGKTLVLIDLVLPLCLLGVNVLLELIIINYHKIIK